MAEASSISRVLRHPTASIESLESAALLTGALFFVIGWAVSWALFWGRDLEIAGAGSIGEYVGIASGIAAVIVFVLGRILVVSRGHPAGGHATAAPHQPGAKLHWFDVAALVTALLIFSWIIVFLRNASAMRSTVGSADTAGDLPGTPTPEGRS
jgi:hypothetical protein